MMAFHKKDSLFSMNVSLESPEALAEDILSKLNEWQLQPQLLCGQACDGDGW